MTKALTRIQEFLKLEASAGLVLMAMALLAMLFANTSLSSIYSGILDTNVRIGIASFEISKPALLWINDGLMAIFFFLVGLEIKREVLAGELSSFDKAALPIMRRWAEWLCRVWSIISLTRDPLKPLWDGLFQRQQILLLRSESWLWSAAARLWR